jgi:hypothetical protein
MPRRCVAVAGAFAALVAAWTAGASARPFTSPPLPPLTSLLLAPADFRSGAAISSQTTQQQGGGREVVTRTFKAGARIGMKPLVSVISIALVDPDASTAAFDYQELDLAAGTAAGRKTLAQLWTADFVKGLGRARGKPAAKVEGTVVGAPIAAGPTSMRLPLSIKTSFGTVRISMDVAQVDRVVAIIALESLGRPLDPGDAVQALAAVRKHLTDAFTVVDTGVPTITGTAAAGQTLTADAGTWTGAPATFSYAWARCDAAGIDCQAIPGATTGAYVVTGADAGAALEVTVTASNSVSSASATSAALTVAN